MGGQSVEDLERVIAAMRRVVERLQGENDQLKKTVGAGGPQYGEVLKENKRLKVNHLFQLLGSYNDNRKAVNDAKKKPFLSHFLSVMIVVVWFLLFLVLLCKVQRGHT